MAVPRPPMMPASPIAPLASAMTMKSGSSTYSRSSSRVNRSAGARRAHRDPAGEALEVVRMQRLPELGHHVVGDIDDRGDAVDADAPQALAQPRRRRSRARSRRESLAMQKIGQPAAASMLIGNTAACGGGNRLDAVRQVAPFARGARSRGRCRTRSCNRRGSASHSPRAPCRRDRAPRADRDPSGSDSGSSMMPSCSSPRPSSRAEQSMPFDSRPRSFARLMPMPPGSCAPTIATATLSPARTFLAPQTICSRSLPSVVTWHTRQFVCIRMAAAVEHLPDHARRKTAQPPVSATPPPGRPG